MSAQNKTIVIALAVSFGMALAYHNNMLPGAKPKEPAKVA